MSKVHTLFKTMDDAIFHQMDNLKASEPAHKFNQYLQQYSPETQKIINQIINLTFFIVPILIIMFLSYQNFSSRSEIQTKVEILELINTYSQKKVEVDTLSRYVVSPRVFSKQADLENQLKQAYSSNNIEMNKMTISGFKQDSSLKPLVKTQVKIRFRNITMSNLSGFLLSILRDFKMKVNGINIKLEKTDSSLSGSLDVIHYAKVNK